MSLYGPRRNRRIPLRELVEKPRVWESFETGQFERAYRMWLLEQESADARRDEREERQEADR